MFILVRIKTLNRARTGQDLTITLPVRWSDSWIAAMNRLFLCRFAAMLLPMTFGKSSMRIIFDRPRPNNKWLVFVCNCPWWQMYSSSKCEPRSLQPTDFDNHSSARFEEVPARGLKWKTQQLNIFYTNFSPKNIFKNILNSHKPICCNCLWICLAYNLCMDFISLNDRIALQVIGSVK